MLATATLIVAALALSNALGNTIENALPDIASRQLGADPNIRLRAAFASVENGDLHGITPVAQAALLSQPLNSLALAVLGIAAEQRGERADQFIMLSNRQSRRAVPAQLWLLENSVTKGNIPAALDRYDIVMRLSSDHWPVLVPLLDTALAEPQIAREFAKHLRQRRTWTNYFLTYMLDQSADPVRLARVVLLSGGIEHARALGLDSAKLLDRLVAVRRPDVARALFLTDPSSERVLLDRPLLSERAFASTLTPVTWQLAAAAAEVFLEQSDGQVMLRIIADPEKEARALRKLLFLSAGRYQLDDTIASVRASPEAGATWRVSCANTGRMLGEQTLNLGTTHHTTSFAVPDGCSAILLDLAVRGGSDQSGSEIVLQSLNLRRAS